MSQFADILEPCVFSTKATSSVFLPDRFNLKFSKEHDKIFSLIDGSARKVCIVAPRGIGKTSIVGLAFPLRHILFKLAKFIVIVSSSNEVAVMHSENLKRELTTNPIIIEMFGSLKSEQFSKDFWVLSNGVAVMPRGRGQQIRGLLFQNSRPDLIVVDDLEDSEEVMSEVQRRKTLEWFMSDLMGSVDVASGSWRVVVIGNFLHEDCLLARLLSDPTWNSITLSLLDENGKSIWPEVYSQEYIDELRKTHQSNMTMDVFYREYMCMPVSTEDALFKASYFKYYDEGDLIGKKLESVVLVDPAKTTGRDSAESAVVGVSVDTSGGAIYVRDIVSGRLHPDELYEESFDMADRIRANTIGIEVTSLNEFITYPFRNEMLRRRRGYNVVELKARGKKLDRIAALVPFYRRGMIYHNRSCCVKLESQLLSFPRSAKLDVMDAFAYIVEMLDEGGRFFTNDDVYDDPESVESEYDELYEDEEPAITGWRYI